MQWEDKAVGHSIQDALDDIQAKTAVWTPLYYGDTKVCTGWRGFADEMWTWPNITSMLCGPVGRGRHSSMMRL